MWSIKQNEKVYSDLLPLFASFYETPKLKLGMTVFVISNWMKEFSIQIRRSKLFVELEVLTIVTNTLSYL